MPTPSRPAIRLPQSLRRRPGSSAWAAATDVNQDAALIEATAEFGQRLTWRGEAASTTQALAFPRTGLTRGDVEVAADSIPTELVRAVSLYADFVLGGGESPGGVLDLGSVRGMRVQAQDALPGLVLAALPCCVGPLARRLNRGRGLVLMALADTLTRAIAAKKRALLKGGMLQPVEWLRRTGPRDERGRQAVSTTMLDAFIEQRPGSGSLVWLRPPTGPTTPVLTILDPVAITDEHTFRWGEHTYSVKKVSGLIKDETTGVRFSSEVTVVR